MKILNSAQIREADKFTIEQEPISSINLMERAAQNAFDWIIDRYIDTNDFIIFAGVGNNGGDGLVIARLLNYFKKKISVYIVEFSKNYSTDFQINLERLKNTNITIKYLNENNLDFNFAYDCVVIDSIFGSGLKNQISGFVSEIIKEINFLPKKSLISIDIPSGLFGEENQTDNKNIIKANYTLTFETPFLSFLFPENEKFVGKFEVIPIGLHTDYLSSVKTNYSIISNNDILKLIKPIKKFAHKGNFGHGLLVAGRYGVCGASILASKAAHKTGIGLLTTHIPKKCVNILQISSPETILNIDKKKKYSTKVVSLSKFNAIGIGPGIGFKKKTIKLVENLFKKYKNTPFVIDADALTILSINSKLIDIIPQKSILTPHIKEFERLVGVTNNHFERLTKQRDLSLKYKVVVVLKGAFSSVSFADGRIFFNPTGNPGMATAGSGDVLTGILLSLLAQGYTSEDAAVIGTYLHGKAGDEANKTINYLSITASDIINYLNQSYNKIFENNNE